MPTKNKVQPKATVDLSGWVMRDFAEWQDAVNDNDVDAMNKIMAGGIITEWQYAGDCHDPEAYMAMQPVEWKAVAEQVGKAVSGMFRRGV